MTDHGNIQAMLLAGAARERRASEQADIDNRFAFHPATTDEKKDAHARVRGVLGNTAWTLTELVPDGREKSLMLTHLEEAMFWANAGIARKGA